MTPYEQLQQAVRAKTLPFQEFDRRGRTTADKVAYDMIEILKCPPKMLVVGSVDGGQLKPGKPSEVIKIAVVNDTPPQLVFRLGLGVEYGIAERTIFVSQNAGNIFLKIDGSNRMFPIDIETPSTVEDFAKAFTESLINSIPETFGKA